MSTSTTVVERANRFVTRLGTRFVPARSGAGYECALCTREFDRDRLNCPACGCRRIVPRE